MQKKTEKQSSKESGKVPKKKLSLKEFEQKVIELAQKGLTAEKIGETLRQQGIHPREYGKKISKILKENNLYVNPDIKNLEEKLERIKRHFAANKQDKRAMREKDRIFAQLRKLKMYFGIEHKRKK